ncbi:MAG: hydroxymethylbilane synthase [Bacteroidota bacterium]
MQKTLRIGTRSSQLAVWQATLVQTLLKENGVGAELVFIKSEGDIDTVTPLYALGVTGIFTKTLDAALLSNRIDIAVHSMKDVPTQLAEGILQAAVLKRGSHKDILVPHPDIADIEKYLDRGVVERTKVESTIGSTVIEKGFTTFLNTGEPEKATIATGSIRRIAQWKLHYPHHTIENLRGNVNTRLQKLKESNWQGAIFAAAGLERIGLRPANAIDLDWMLPAPAQGAIMVVCRDGDQHSFQSCQSLNDESTALCTKIERDFLSTLMGGCSTPISAIAQVKNGQVHFDGNIVSVDGTMVASRSGSATIALANDMGQRLARQLLLQPNVQKFIETIRGGKI